MPKMNKKQIATNLAEVEMGKELQDTITGFKGKVSAVTLWFNGCLRAQLEAIDRDGNVIEAWFDVERLGIVPKEKPAVGGGRPAPARSGVSR